MIKIEELEIRGIYEVDARNFEVGIWNGGGFIGIRHKFNSTFLDLEYHWDSDPYFGTCIPIKKIGEVPNELELDVRRLELFEYLSDFVKRRL